VTSTLIVQPRLPKVQQQGAGLSEARKIEHRWNAIVAAACQDRRLQGNTPSYFEEPNGDYSNRRCIYLKDLLNPSTWICARLHYLITNVTRNVVVYRDSAVIAEISRLLATTAAQLKWDALCDIQLADNLFSEVNYNSRLEAFLKSRQPWHGMQEVIDLRSRVVYLLEVLTLLYDITLRGAAAERLQQGQSDIRELQEACEWLGAYATKLAELTRPAVSLEEARTPLRARLRGRRGAK
jgi:hypothetical protein